MRSIRLLGLLFTGTCLGGLGACGSSDDEASGTPLTCEAVQDPSFCWHAAVESAYSCIGGAADSGVTPMATMSTDRTTCTYPDGVIVKLDSPLPATTSSSDPGAPSPFDSYEWRLTITRDGKECARFEDSDSGFMLSAPIGRFVETSSASGLQITCPDGTQYSTANALALLSCAFGGLPGFGYSWSGSMASRVSFFLMGGENGSWWECSE